MTVGPVAYVMGDMDLVTPLGRAGVPCAVATERGAPPTFSRYVHRSIEGVGRSETWHVPEEMVRRLLVAAATESEPPVLFYQSDPELLMVSRFRESLGEAFRFCVADAELVEDLLDKARFVRLAQQLELDIPQTEILEPGGPLGAAQSMPFPLIIKPVLRRATEWDVAARGAKAVRVDSHAELTALWARFDSLGLALVAQEFIAGPEARLETYHVYVDHRGDIAGEFTGRKIRTRPEFGLSTAVEVTDIPELRRLGREITERLQLRGVAKLDFKRDERDGLRLLEVNLRFNLWHHPGALAGVNIPALVYADLTSQPRPPTRQCPNTIRWCKPWADLPAARDAGVRLLPWLAFAARCRAKTAVSWRDPMPTLGAAVYGWRQHRGRR